jgi:hypothetical protein
VMFKCGDCAGQGKCWSSPSCSSNNDWTVAAVWIMSGSCDAPDYLTCPRIPL